MSETKFTPGPWDVVMGSDGQLYVESPGGDLVAFVMPDLGVEAQEFNAELLAAATKLYKVVQAVADWNKRYPPERIYSHYEIKTIAGEMEAINVQAIAALASARGEA